MSVRVSFMTPGQGDASKPMLLAPKKALITDGNASYVWTVQNGVAQRVPVTRGKELEDGVEITRGLNDGDEVIVEPSADLKEGEKVIPRPA
jgi:multidrug efflux pump subunit AcrA (membrane-fusion protein)